MIYFVGAGPGDVDLITVKGRELLTKADVLIYAGSLVWDQHLHFCPDHCLHFNSAGMTLEEVGALFREHDGPQKTVIRLHTGDPTLYGAIGEQIALLDDENRSYQVIPGVSSFTAASAAINREFTAPGVSQTVIVTRMEGKTPVPEGEALERLASHRASMAIFLSVQEIDKVVEKLKQGYQDGKTPVAVVYKASWPDQKVLFGTLDTIARQVKEAQITRFAQILVGDFLHDSGERSQLYHPEFSHGFRKGHT